MVKAQKLKKKRKNIEQQSGKTAKQEKGGSISWTPPTHRLNGYQRTESQGATLDVQVSTHICRRR